MRISTKLIVNTVIIAMFSVLISTVAIGWMVYFNANKFLEELAVDRFVSLRDSKVDRIHNHYATVVKQVVTFAHDYTIVKAMREFKEAFNNYGTQVGNIKYNTKIIKKYIDQFTMEYAKLNDGAVVDSKKLLNTLDDDSFVFQYNYILQNPYSVNSKSKYDAAQDGSNYSQIHKRFHPIIREYQEQFKYHDILLIDAATGNVVYSVQKKLDYATSLFNGPYAKSVIGDVFRQALAANSNDFFTITDFEAYIPSYSNVASFVATPIFDEMNNKIGVLIFHMTPDFINSVMTSGGMWEGSGWGKTGESYILGHDSIMRTMSRFFVEDPESYLQQMAKLGVDPNTLRLINAKQTTIGLQTINSVGATNVVQGNTGVSYYKDYRKQPVIATYAQFNIPGLKWGIICGIDTVEAFAAAHALADKVVLYGIIIVVIIAMIAIFIGFALSRQVSVPITKFSNLIYRLAKTQDLTKRIKVSSDDELGSMAKALNTLISNLQQACKATIESTAQVHSAATKLFSMNKELNQEIVNNQMENVADFIQDRVKITEETEDKLQLLSSRLENLSDQFKIFEEESDRTSGW